MCSDSRRRISSLAPASSVSSHEHIGAVFHESVPPTSMQNNNALAFTWWCFIWLLAYTRSPLSYHLLVTVWRALTHVSSRYVSQVAMPPWHNPVLFHHYLCDTSGLATLESHGTQHSPRASFAHVWKIVDGFSAASRNFVQCWVLLRSIESVNYFLYSPKQIRQGWVVSWHESHIGDCHSRCLHHWRQTRPTQHADFRRQHPWYICSWWKCWRHTQQQHDEWNTWDQFDAQPLFSSSSQKIVKQTPPCTMAHSRFVIIMWHVERTSCHERKDTREKAK